MREEKPVKLEADTGVQKCYKPRSTDECQLTTRSWGEAGGRLFIESLEGANPADILI